MRNIEIIANSSYIPKHMVTSKELANKFSIQEEYILKRTGIESRFFVEEENIEDLAIKSANNLMKKSGFDEQKIGMIIVATTSTNKLMPGISFLVQKELKIKECICLDILCGCSGYINAFDIARNYIAIGRVDYALVIGVEILSKYTKEDDIDTRIILSDGAGSTLIGVSNEDKKYYCIIESNGMHGEYLTCDSNNKIYMDGKSIYKYAITDTVSNIEKLLHESGENINNIKYIIPHQSNLRILKSIADRLEIDFNKMYVNIQRIGNTFCASIPIAVENMYRDKLLKKGDKVILIGYGGGLNLGSILLEV